MGGDDRDCRGYVRERCERAGSRGGESHSCSLLRDLQEIDRGASSSERPMGRVRRWNWQRIYFWTFARVSRGNASRAVGRDVSWYVGHVSRFYGSNVRRGFEHGWIVAEHGNGAGPAWAPRKHVRGGTGGARPAGSEFRSRVARRRGVRGRLVFIRGRGKAGVARDQREGPRGKDLRGGRRIRGREVHARKVTRPICRSDERIGSFRRH